jgi:sugar lactone lactonase YvrE
MLETFHFPQTLTMKNFSALLVLAALSACGGGSGSSNTGTTTPPPAQATPGITLLAGQPGGPGNIDGTGSGARFSWPTGSVMDSAGNLYVADAYAIRKITPAGVVTTLAGNVTEPGYADGPGTAARFNFLTTLAIDPAGNLYGKSGNAIRKITPAGVVSTLAGSDSEIGSADGAGAAARFGNGGQLGMGSDGKLYFADANRTIRKITLDGVVSTWVGKPGGDCVPDLHYPRCRSADGQGSAALFQSVEGLAGDREGNIYVTDNYTVRKITPDGTVTTLAGVFESSAAADGSGASARFVLPGSLAVDANGIVYVADHNTVRKMTPAGQVSTIAGNNSAEPAWQDATGAAARFNNLYGLAIDSSGALYASDSGNAAVRKISAAGVVTTLAGAPLSGAIFGYDYTAGLAYSGGTLYYTANHSVRKRTADGSDSLVAGGGTGAPADGSGAAATFSDMLRGVAVDASGNLYVADDAHIRKVTPGGVVTTVFKSEDFYLQHGLKDYAGDSRGSFEGVTVDSAGTVYASDYNDRIFKISAAGSASILTDSIRHPNGLALDSSGNLYVTEDGQAIRKVTPSGVVSTLAGAPGEIGAVDGTGAAARFAGVNGLAIDSSGNLYAADMANNAVRKITPAGVVTTVVGKFGAQGTIPGPLPGTLSRPYTLALGDNGALYVVAGAALLKVQF